MKNKTNMYDLANKHRYIKSITDVLEDSFLKEVKELLAPLVEDLKYFGFIVCVHTHYSEFKLSIYDSTEVDGHMMELTVLDIDKVSDNFPKDVRDIVEKHLEYLK